MSNWQDRYKLADIRPQLLMRLRENEAHAAVLKIRCQEVEREIFLTQQALNIEESRFVGPEITMSMGEE